MITTPVPTVALLAAARAMTEPEPPRDLGLERAVRESLLPPAPLEERMRERSSQPPPSSRRPTFRVPSTSSTSSTSSTWGAGAGGPLLESEPFEFELTPRSSRNPHAAPPLAEELGLDHLLADFKPQRSWSHSSGLQWLRAYGLWILAAALVLWLIVTFAASWLPA